MDPQVTDNPDKAQYEIRVDGELAGSDLRRVTADVEASFTGSVCAPMGCFDKTDGVPVLFAGAVPTLVYGANVAVVQAPSFFNPFGNSSVSFTLSMRATPQSGVVKTSGTLYIK